MHPNKPLLKMSEDPRRESESIGSNGLLKTDFTSDIQYHLNEMEKEMYISQTIYNKNQDIVRILDWHLNKIRIINNLILKDPRFEWKEIQNEMDRLFKVDPELTGFDIQFDFKKIDLPNRALIKADLYHKK